MTVYRLDGLRFAYRETTALDGLDLAVAQGERVALIGANGSGKSTLLRVMAALAFPTAGAALAFGAPLTEAAFRDAEAAFAFRRRVGIVFQSADVQLFNPTVLDEIAFGPLQLGWSRDRVLARVEEMLATFGLDPLRHRAPHRLSGGEKKRVALAAVMALDPEVLLLDEPTAALDPAGRDGLVHLLAGEALAGRTIVTATHELDILPEIAERAVVLREGRVIGDGPVAAVLGDGALLTRARLTHAHAHAHAGHAHVHHHAHALDPARHAHDGEA